MNYQFIITDHYKKALVYVESAVTPDLVKALESLPCVASVKTWDNKPSWALQVERTSEVTTNQLAIQLRKFFKDYPISSNPADLADSKGSHWIRFN